MSTVIIGGGIIGVSTAYYLSESSASTSPTSIYIIESSPKLFASASGYAGGFLARDWFSPAVASLGALSFDLHKQLAEAHDGGNQWGYSKTTTLSLSPSNAADEQDWVQETTDRAVQAPVRKLQEVLAPGWLKSSSRQAGLNTLDDGSGTAQLDPLRLCRFLLAECQARGVQLLQPAKVVAVRAQGGEAPFALRVEADSSTREIQCKRLVFAAGAWTPKVFSHLFPSSGIRIPVSSLSGHSLVLRSPHWNVGDEADGKSGAHAVYTAGGYEIYARGGGELYLAGLNDSALPVPEKPTDRIIDRKSIATLRALASFLCEGELAARSATEAEAKGKVQVVREGLCWRPVTPSGAPIIDRLDVLPPPSTPGAGVWTAVGHGPWGISLSLGTGKVIGELMQGKKTSADISSLKV